MYTREHNAKIRVHLSEIYYVYREAWLAITGEMFVPKNTYPSCIIK